MVNRFSGCGGPQLVAGDVNDVQGRPAMPGFLYKPAIYQDNAGKNLAHQLQ